MSVRPFTKIDTVLLRVKSLEESKRWYEDVLGFKATYLDQAERLVVFDVGGETSLTIWELKQGKATHRSGGSPCFPLLYTRDIRAAWKTLTGRGVKASEVQGDSGGTMWFTFEDPDGNKIEACSY